MPRKRIGVVENGSNGGFDAIILDDAGNVIYRTHDLKQAGKEYAPKDNVSNTINPSYAGIRLKNERS